MNSSFLLTVVQFALAVIQLSKLFFLFFIPQKNEKKKTNIYYKEIPWHYEQNICIKNIAII